MKRFSGFKNILLGSKLETFEQLEIYARKYPRKTLEEIINLDEVYRFHQQKDWLQRASTREKMDYHFDNIFNFFRDICTIFYIFSNYFCYF